MNEFKESRYIDAFGITQERYGSISIKNDTLTIIYIKPKKESVIYEKEKLVILNENNKEYFFEEHPQLEYMGLLLKSIFINDYDTLIPFFELNNTNEITILTPKSFISNTIDLIEIIKKDSKLKKIIFEMRNKDTLTIETIN